MTVRTFNGASRLYSWASILEDKAREQLFEAASMPFVWPHAAGMPDMHWGLGAPIGLVFPTLGAICPATVGVDIGCGMIAAATTLTWAHLEESGIVDMASLADLRKDIERIIPMSKGNYNAVPFDSFTEARITSLEEKEGVKQADEITGNGTGNWRNQLGSLGGGNHFIEFCRDTQDRVWIFLHSGSRGVGNRLATRHIKVAQHLCRQWWIDLPNPDLAYLIEGSDEFWAYMRDLRWAQHFAMLNREEMIHRCRLALQDWYGDDVAFGEMIRCHHNYTEQMSPELLRHYRSFPKGHRGNVWLTRKGAISARSGERGLIPGSMGAHSYVVTGKGNPLSLFSAPHGAGRMYGRRQAESLFSTEKLTEAMRGIEWSRQIADRLVDEIPYAYKDIHVVLADSSDLIEVTEELTQFINIKGE
ncbi:MAG TPA: RtcB family protein [Nitrospira sp.]|nr:RtcB family protein [Nitrospira sp.]